MSIIITGGAGFIGVNLAKCFVDQGLSVYLLDNLCRGSIQNIETFKLDNVVKFKHVNLHIYDEVRKVFSDINKSEPVTEVWHMAANSDIPAGVEDSDIDLRDTFMTTYNILKVMKETKIRFLSFASTSAIYGDLGVTPLKENIGPLLPISHYGAMKLASEACISAATESYLDKSIIFRFPNVIGIPATHGVIYDFIDKLKMNESTLHVLGDGSQQKSYLHVDDLIAAMLHVKNISVHGPNIFNIGADDNGVSVKTIAEEVVQHFRPGANILYGEGNKGWVGDVPKFIFSTEKIKLTGWRPRLSSREAVTKAVSEIIKQRG